MNTSLKAFANVLAISAHTDDAEIGAGGTIARLIEEGSNVEICALSWCGDENLKEEYFKAAAQLGIPKTGIFLKNFKRRTFPQHRQEILDCLWQLGRKKEYDLILIPSDYDTHQDHGVVNDESFRSFKHISTIWGYEIQWNNKNFRADGFVELSPQHVRTKISAAACYQSQIQEGRNYAFDPISIRAHVVDRGSCIRVQYAEAFQEIRFIYRLE